VKEKREKEIILKEATINLLLQKDIMEKKEMMTKETRMEVTKDTLKDSIRVSNPTPMDTTLESNPTPTTSINLTEENLKLFTMIQTVNKERMAKKKAEALSNKHLLQSLST
jgi:hypothetical protein